MKLITDADEMKVFAQSQDDGTGRVPLWVFFPPAATVAQIMAALYWPKTASNWGIITEEEWEGDGMLVKTNNKPEYVKNLLTELAACGASLVELSEEEKRSHDQDWVANVFAGLGS